MATLKRVAVCLRAILYRLHKYAFAPKILYCYARDGNPQFPLPPQFLDTLDEDPVAAFPRGTDVLADIDEAVRENRQHRTVFRQYLFRRNLTDED